MTKGWAPCSPLWPGEQYEGCEWLIPLDCWQVGPLSNLGTHFSTGLGRCLTVMGKTRLLTATEPSPRAETGSHCEGKLLSPLSACGCLCNVRRWTWGKCATGGGLEWQWTRLRLCECYSYRLRGFIVWNHVSEQILLTSLGLHIKTTANCIDLHLRFHWFYWYSFFKIPWYFKIDVLLM